MTARGTGRPPASLCSLSLRRSLSYAARTHGQLQMKHGTAKRIMLGPQPSAVSVCNRAADGQPQAHTIGLAGEKRFKDPFQFPFGDAGACIANGDQHDIIRSEESRVGK